MNREIIFRAKRSDNGEWVEGSLLQSEATVGGRTNCEIVGRFAFANDIGRYEVDPTTIGQFTGLTDSKGNKVFEGDIFTANEYPFTDDGKPNYYGVVEWIFAGFQYVLKLSNPEKIGISEGINEPLEDGGWLTVIGTIHDTHLTKQS